MNKPCGKPQRPWSEVEQIEGRPQKTQAATRANPQLKQQRRAQG